MHRLLVSRAGRFAQAGADLNPKAITIQRPAEIQWRKCNGAKDAECVLQIVGMGPATNTPAEET